MPNAAGECNAFEETEANLNSLIPQPKAMNQPDFRLRRVETGHFAGESGRWPLQMLPQATLRVTPVVDGVRDPAFASAADPDRIVVEIANDFPDIGAGCWRIVL
jgi:hypothetical protein